MKVKELKNKILITELDPKAKYICLFNWHEVRVSDLPRLKNIWYVAVHDVEKAIRFVKVNYEKKTKI